MYLQHLSKQSHTQRAAGFILAEKSPTHVNRPSTKRPIVQEIVHARQDCPWAGEPTLLECRGPIATCHRRSFKVPRVISFIVLLAIVLLVGAIFFQVMAQFFVPLFLACVLLVVFEPVHRWIGDRMPKWPRTAAMLTTVAIILLVVLPLVWLGFKAYVDFHALLSRPTLEETAEQNQQPVAKTAPKPSTAPSSVSFRHVQRERKGAGPAHAQSQSPREQTGR